MPDTPPDAAPGRPPADTDEARTLDPDDEAMRAMVSRQWAEDWNSPEDSIYDD